uniref:BHLH domain-containing protein n=1 Tax=Myripristis murdjan TaxID=586833 RepID=A0A667XTC5_9TELE
MACVPSPLTRWTHINRRLSGSVAHFSSVAPRAHLSPQKAPQQATLKPLLEKRRRARINDSLGHLKSLILLILPLTGRDIPQTVTRRATKPASSASPLCFPNRAWTKTLVSG